MRRGPRTSHGAAVAVERREETPLGSEERRRISGLLHDDVQQLLFGIRLKASLIRGKLGAGDVAAIEDDLDDIDDWAEEAIDAVRGVSMLLRSEPGE